MLLKEVDNQEVGGRLRNGTLTCRRTFQDDQTQADEMDETYSTRGED